MRMRKPAKKQTKLQTDELLNPSFTKTRASVYNPSIKYLNLTHEHNPLILGEAALASGDQGINDYDLESSLGTAIWTADWMLYAMSVVREHVTTVTQRKQT
jgi:hypothetical protein